MSVPYPEFKEELDKRVPGLDSKPLMDLIGEPKRGTKVYKNALGDLSFSLASGMCFGSAGYQISRFFGLSPSPSIGAGAVVGTILTAGLYRLYREFQGGDFIPKKKEELKLDNPEEWEEPYTAENIADQVDKKLEELI